MSNAVVLLASLVEVAAQVSELQPAPPPGAGNRASEAVEWLLFFAMILSPLLILIGVIVFVFKRIKKGKTKQV